MIKQEIQKLLVVGFINPIQHLTWLANIMPVKEKMVKFIAHDFCDLDKAYRRDEF